MKKSFLASATSFHIFHSTDKFFHKHNCFFITHTHFFIDKLFFHEIVNHMKTTENPSFFRRNRVFS